MAITQAAREQVNELSIDLSRLEVLDAFLKKVIEDGTHPAAAVTVQRGGVEIFHGAYGVGSLDGSALRDDAIYPVASVTKPITATLIAMLQEDGLIDIWFDNLQQYFPDFTGEGKDEVLPWHLMCHISGMDDGAMREYGMTVVKNVFELEVPKDDAPEKDWLDLGMRLREKIGLPEAPRNWKACSEVFGMIERGAPLKNKPGTQFAYCNTGYQMLADIIEKISGESLDDFSRRRLFEPLGMMDSYFILPKDKWQRAIKKDKKMAGAKWHNSKQCYTNTSGGGGLKATMRDLTRFGQMYLQSGTLDGVRILSPASVREFTSNHNADIPLNFWFSRWLSANWGLGWNVRDGKKDDMGLLRSNRAYDHAGYGGARLLVDPDFDLVVSFYLVDFEEKPYPLHSRITNIIYSALD